MQITSAMPVAIVLEYNVDAHFMFRSSRATCPEFYAKEGLEKGGARIFFVTPVDDGDRISCATMHGN